MDNKIKMLRNGSMPKNEWRNLLCNVLGELSKQRACQCMQILEKPFNLSLQEALYLVTKMKKVQHESFDELSYLSIYDGNYVIRFINKHSPTLHQYHFVLNPTMLQSWRVLDK